MTASNSPGPSSAPSGDDLVGRADLAISIGKACGADGGRPATNIYVIAEELTDRIRALEAEVTSLQKMQTKTEAERDEAAGLLEPLATMAGGANMNDPISKWLRIAHLRNAEAFLDRRKETT